MAEPGVAFSQLHMAAHAGDAAAIQALISRAATTELAATTAKGDTPLHLASLGGHVEALSLILSALPGADANAQNAAGWTPLMLALLSDAPSARRLACVHQLLGCGASVVPVASGGWNAALCAARRGDHLSLAALLETGALDAAHLAARTAEGDTALHLAAHSGAATCVRLLLAAGVDSGALNSQGLDAAALCVSAACTPHADASTADASTATSATYVASGAAVTSVTSSVTSARRGAAEDSATAQFEETLARLASSHAASASLSAPVSLSAGWGALHGELLPMLAGAPATVPYRRILALASLLRRCGCEDAPPVGRPPAARPSAIAARRGLTALAALLRAPTPASACVLCVRRPLERPPPTQIILREGGAVLRPHLASEPPRLRRATLNAMRSADEAQHLSSHLTSPSGPGEQGRGGRDSTASAAAAAAVAAAEAAAEEGAAEAVEGVSERWHTFDLACELPAEIRQIGRDCDEISMSHGETAPESAAQMASVAASRLHEALASRPTSARESLAHALAAAQRDAPHQPPRPTHPNSGNGAANGSGARTVLSPASALLPSASAAAARRLPSYRQRRRWGDAVWGTIALGGGGGRERDERSGGAGEGGGGGGDGGGGGGGDVTRVSVLELEPQMGAPLLRDAHLDLLRQVLGPEALGEIAHDGNEAHASQQRQPWSVYVKQSLGGGGGEDGGERRGGGGGGGGAWSGDGGGGGEWIASAEIFSLDTPHLLAFAVEADAEAGMMSALSDAFSGAHEGEEGGEEEEEEDEEGLAQGHRAVELAGGAIAMDASPMASPLLGSRSRRMPTRAMRTSE